MNVIHLKLIFHNTLVLEKEGDLRPWILAFPEEQRELQFGPDQVKVLVIMGK